MVENVTIHKIHQLIHFDHPRQFDGLKKQTNDMIISNFPTKKIKFKINTLHYL
jgi:methylase of polypeptide subunit release factors